MTYLGEGECGGEECLQYGILLDWLNPHLSWIYWHPFHLSKGMAQGMDIIKLLGHEHEQPQPQCTK